MKLFSKDITKVLPGNIEQTLYLAYLQGKEKQHKDVKSCVGFLQLTCRQKGSFCQQQQRSNQPVRATKFV